MLYGIVSCVYCLSWVYNDWVVFIYFACIFWTTQLISFNLFIYPAELEYIDQTEEEKDDYLAQAVFEQMHLNDDEVCKSLFIQIKKISLLGEPLVNGHEWYTMHMIAEKV